MAQQHNNMKLGTIGGSPRCPSHETARRRQCVAGHHPPKAEGFFNHAWLCPSCMEEVIEHFAEHSSPRIHRIKICGTRLNIGVLDRKVLQALRAWLILAFGPLSRSILDSHISFENIDGQSYPPRGGSYMEE